MKTIQYALLAAGLLSPLAAAQVSERSVDADNQDTAVERASAFDKNLEQLRADISDVKRETESLRSNATEQGREKLDALTTRIEALETRSIAAGEGTERDFNENKHKFKNELKKIRRELKDVRVGRKYRTATPDAAPGLPGYP